MRLLLIWVLIIVSIRIWIWFGLVLRTIFGHMPDTVADKTSSSMRIEPFFILFTVSWQVSLFFTHETYHKRQLAFPFHLALIKSVFFWTTIVAYFIAILTYFLLCFSFIFFAIILKYFFILWTARKNMSILLTT
jgi:hypothetical protein